MTKLKVVDLFCGAGGTSQGAEQSGAAKVIGAVNHWSVAVDTHSANFPDAKHINSRLDQVNPGEFSKPHVLFASPECTHHSNARGGRPTSDQQRSGSWDLMRWIEHHRPPWIVVENVPELKSWGPIGDNGRPLEKFKGKFFDAWLCAIQAAGYRVDHRLLNAADYGAATSRTRLFIVARKGNRRIHWPDPTHAERIGGELPGFALKPWRAAAEVIDWSIPCRSVFLRKTPLKDNTLARIEAGLRKFVGPYVVLLRNNSTAGGIDQPLNTITSGGRHHGLAVPFQYKAMGSDPGLTRSIGKPVRTLVARESEGIVVPFIKPNFNERDGQKPRSHDVAGALPTVTSRGAGDLILPYVIDTNHTGPRQPRSIDEPFPPATTKRGQMLCVPIIVTYYSNGRAQAVSEPFCTITTRDRAGLALAVIETCGIPEARNTAERSLMRTMTEVGVSDVAYRMFNNCELSLAQGFPAPYIFRGNKGDVTRQIGNAVCPGVAEAITLSLAGAA